MSEAPRPFWMVMGLNQGPPRFQHPSHAEAVREARRLAALNPGVGFVVLASTDHFKTADPVQHVRLLDDDGEMPF